MNNTSHKELREIRDDFIAQWGAVANAWGINRTMAQIHALLMVTPQPLSTDDVMDELKISRGNAHSNLRELVNWGLLRSVLLKGERKEYFEAEKDVWKIFAIIVRERKRREIDPIVEVLHQCKQRTESIKGAEASAFHEQVSALCEFVDFATKTMDGIVSSSENKLMTLALKFLH